jgi:hypothetical protein
VPFQAGGSVGWSVSVPRAKANEARNLVSKAVGLSEYVRFVDGAKKNDWSPHPVPMTEELIALEHTQALRKYSATTAVGKILRDEDLERAMQTLHLGFVRSVRWIDRPFVTRNLQPVRAISAKVTVGENLTARASDAALDVELLPKE